MASVPPLLVRFQRLSPDRHRLDFERADGSRDGCELETRSTLWHDLVHFAVESEAGLADGFYGRVARGIAYAALGHAERDDALHDEIWQVERVVGPLQTAWRRGLEPASFVARLHGYLGEVDAPPPAWLDAAFVARVAERLRQLDGHWRGTAFGAVMELRFAPGC